MPSLDSPVAAIHNLGPADAKRLQRLGIETVRDLLMHLPASFGAFPIKAVNQLVGGEEATVVGTIQSIRAKRTPRRRMQLTEGVLVDGAGGRLNLVWFNQPYVANSLREGTRVALAGTVKPRGYGGGLQMQNPRQERLVDGSGPATLGGLLPTYPLTKGVTSRKLQGWVESVLPLAEDLEEVIPTEVLWRHHLLPVAVAVRRAHQPKTYEEFRAARDRLAWQELFELQAAFVLLRRSFAEDRAQPVPYRQEVIDAFKAGLPFALTNAQRRATWEVFRDMEREVPMNRLLNGDVGSGKTAVAAAAAAMAHAAQLQSVIMAPTEILARQHLGKLRAYLETTFPGLTVELLVSGLAAPERRRVRTAAASGHCSVVVGTHALIEEDVTFANLGLAVVDEQHRFGTRQRELLRAKGAGRPHFLAMTATPIPRTLALARYGEMTQSVIDELPPGRTPVATAVVPPDERRKAYELVEREVAAGRQAFVICPLIEETDLSDAKAATKEFERLRDEVFPDLRLSLVHGRIKDKDSVMREFADGASDVLIATAVVEVGVDVPNATVMMIEGADRFGLAQLHQFRGRVGRGTHQSHCLLLAEETNETSLERLRLMETIHDGFQLALEDMRLRGAGELLGAKQHGVSDAAMEALLKPRLLDEVREEAETVIGADPQLEKNPALARAVARRLETASLS